jgi:hypothetical protein
MGANLCGQSIMSAGAALFRFFKTLSGAWARSRRACSRWISFAGCVCVWRTKHEDERAPSVRFAVIIVVVVIIIVQTMTTTGLHLAGGARARN